jgi:hypothetical protein
VTDSPEKEVSSPGKEVMSPLRVNMRRTRLSTKKPKTVAAQLEPKVTQINLNNYSIEQ